MDDDPIWSESEEGIDCPFCGTMLGHSVTWCDGGETPHPRWYRPDYVAALRRQLAEAKREGAEEAMNGMADALIREANRATGAQRETERARRSARVWKKTAKSWRRRAEFRLALSQRLMERIFTLKEALVRIANLLTYPASSFARQALHDPAAPENPKADHE